MARDHMSWSWRDIATRGQFIINKVEKAVNKSRFVVNISLLEH